MKEEPVTSERMCVLEHTMLPQGRQAVGCRWEPAIKRNAAGGIERFRGRQVSPGFCSIQKCTTIRFALRRI